MGKIGGLALLAALVLSGCTAPASELETAPTETVEQAVAEASTPEDMLIELRPQLTSLDRSDADLTSEALAACVAMLDGNKDSYREAVLKEYEADLTLGLDHLTVAAAAKKHLCP